MVSAGSALLVIALPASLLAARHLLLVRPVIFSLVFLALFLWVLERYRAEGNPRLLLALPLAQVVWANCQGLSALGPALVAAYAAGGGLGRLTGRRELPAGRRALAGGGAGCLPAGRTGDAVRAGGGAVAAAAAGAGDAGGGQRVLGGDRRERAAVRAGAGRPGQMAPLVAVMAIAAVSFLVARPLLWGRVLATLAFAGLALMANRNVLLFFWVAIPLAAMNAAPAVAGGLARGCGSTPPGWAPPAGFAVAVALVATGLGLAVRAETPLDQPAPFRVPEAVGPADRRRPRRESGRGSRVRRRPLRRLL